MAEFRGWCTGHADKRVNNFGVYFFGRYVDNGDKPQRWAKCFAEECPNTNMILEAFHSQLKNIFFGKKRNRRLDTLIYRLSCMVDTEVKGHFQSVTKDKYTYKEKDIVATHRRAITIMSDELTRIAPATWNVRSQNQRDHLYTVQLREQCTVDKCLQCRDCGVCHHMVTCTCQRNVREELCVHIHACCVHFCEEVRQKFRKRRREDNFEELKRLEPFIAAATSDRHSILHDAAKDALESAREKLQPGDFQQVCEAVLAAVVPDSPHTPLSTRPRWNSAPVHQRQKYLKRRRLIEN